MSDGAGEAIPILALWGISGAASLATTKTVP